VPGRLDGLILGGGADVAPDRYGAEPVPRVPPSPRRPTLRRAIDLALSPLIGGIRRAAGLDPRAPRGPDLARDELELALLGHAEAAGLPVLGICRGAQLINVHAGGTLYQDLSDFYTERPGRWTVFPRMAVELSRPSRLEQALGSPISEVNSMHRQGIDRVGRGLRIVARDRRGVVQAIEHPDRWFWIGVQWHPEYLPQIREQRRLIASLVAAAQTAPRAPDQDRLAAR
jgi:putative glutamine amidotransferase